MIRLLWALSAQARYYLRRYMPTNIALDAIRTRRGLKWGILAMLLAVPYFLAANYCITLIEGGGPGWLNLLVLLFCWNALKFLIMGLVSVILLVRARVQEAVERRRPPHERGTVPQVPDGECGVMGAVIYTRSARPNWATHAHQRAACQCLAAELGYEVSGEFHDNGRTRPALDQALATIRDGQASALIVADLYRLSRPSTEFARIIEALDEADVPLYVVGQGRVSLPATPELGIMLAIAEYEAKHSEEDFTL